MHRSRSYSSLAKSNTLTNEVTNNKSNMNPGFVTGLIDASLVNNTLSKRELSTKGPTSYSLNLEVWGDKLKIYSARLAQAQARQGLDFL